MVTAGDVVSVSLVGAMKTKRRPAVVISTDLFHTTRPDIIVSALTTQVSKATTPTDYVLKDWAAAGLHRPSAFRVYLNTVIPADATVIGHLSDLDWQEVQKRLRLALAVS